ncbi:MAG: HNH endonuclease [Candidatus Thorarchaeota archaeon]
MASGKKHRGLTFKDKMGYKKYSNSGESVHRHVAERMLGRKLRKGEVVHHKNRDKTDNRRSNLQVFSSRKAHHETHKKSKKRFGRW